MTKDGKYYCANPGCKSISFKLEDNGENACNHHAGAAIFHDLKKSWSCCKKVTYDWDDF
jgi:hypothetical protein